MLRDGNKRRTTEPTAINKTSSRSHAVLQVSSFIQILKKLLISIKVTIATSFQSYLYIIKIMLQIQEAYPTFLLM